MPARAPRRPPGATFFALAAILTPQASWAGSDLIDGWTDLLLSVSRLVLVFGSVLGVAYAAQSMLRAYRADEDQRLRHLGAAVLAGSLTMIGVFVGWLSGLLVPAT